MVVQFLTHFSAIGDACNPNDSKFGVFKFFEFPTWYKYMTHGVMDGFDKCIPKVEHLGDMWLIVLAGIDILLYIAGIVAFGAVLFGGYRYLTSQGEPDKTKEAKDTIINGLVGAAIAMIAAVVVTFVAGQFGA